MDLYSELSKDQYRGMIGGRIVGIGHSYERAAKEHIARRTEQARASGQIITGYRPLEFGYYRSDRKGRLDVPIFGRDPKAAEEDLRKEQARLAGIQQQTYEKQQADIAKQLQIVQGEKSAVAKMTQEYTNMLAEEAERRKKAQEEARIAAQTSAANRVMEGQICRSKLQVIHLGLLVHSSSVAVNSNSISQQGPIKDLVKFNQEWLTSNDS